MNYVGIDWAYGRAAWCALEEAGTIKSEGLIPADEDGLARLVLDLGVEVKACVEMMSGAIWVRDQLELSGWSSRSPTPATAGEGLHRLGQVPVLSFEIMQRVISSRVRIDIENDETRVVARPDADPDRRVPLPETLDLIGLGRRILEAMGRRRRLVDVYREYRPPPVGVAQRDREVGMPRARPRH